MKQKVPKTKTVDEKTRKNKTKICYSLAVAFHSTLILKSKYEQVDILYIGRNDKIKNTNFVINISL